MPTETIFNPKDNITKEKFKAFEYVNGCYMRDRENLNKVDDVLGESDEIKEAFAISKNSLKQAHKSLSDKELKQALDDEVIASKQIKEFKQSKNMLEMEAKRENSLGDEHQTNHQI